MAVYYVVNSHSSPEQENIEPTEVDEDKLLLWCYCRRPEEGQEMIACDDNIHVVYSCSMFLVYT